MEHRDENSEYGTVQRQRQAGDDAHHTVNDHHKEHDQDNTDQARQQARLQATLAQGRTDGLKLDTVQRKRQLPGGDDIGQVRRAVGVGTVAKGDDSGIGVNARGCVFVSTIGAEISSPSIWMER